MLCFLTRCFIVFVLLCAVSSFNDNFHLPDKFKSKGERISGNVNDAIIQANKLSGTSIAEPLENRHGFMRLFFTATPSPSTSPTPSVSPSKSSSPSPSVTPSSSPSLTPSSSVTITPTPTPTKSASPTPFRHTAGSPSDQEIVEIEQIIESTYRKGERLSNEVIELSSDGESSYRLEFDVKLSENGVVSLDGIRELISFVTCSEEGTVNIKIVDSILILGNIRDVFPIGSVLVFSNDIFGACRFSPDEQLPGESLEDFEIRSLSTTGAAFSDSYIIIDSVSGDSTNILISGFEASIYAMYESGNIIVERIDDVSPLSRTIHGDLALDGDLHLPNVARELTNSLKVEKEKRFLGPYVVKATGEFKDVTTIKSFISNWTTTGTYNELTYNTGSSILLRLGVDYSTSMDLFSETVMLLNKPIKGIKFDFLKAINTGKFKIPSFKIGLFAEIYFIAKGDVTIEQKLENWMKFEYQSEKSEITLYMKGPYTDLEFGRDVKVLSSPSRTFQFIPSTINNSGKEMKLKTYLGIRPQVALYIPFISARLSVDIGTELEGKTLLQATPYPPVTSGLTIGNCSTCHRFQIDLLGKITNASFSANIGVEFKKRFFGKDWNITFEKTLKPLTYPGNPTVQLKIGTGCFYPQYESNSVVCGKICCDRSDSERGTCSKINNENKCIANLPTPSTSTSTTPSESISPSSSSSLSSTPSISATASSSSRTSPQYSLIGTPSASPSVSPISSETSQASESAVASVSSSAPASFSSIASIEASVSPTMTLSSSAGSSTTPSSSFSASISSEASVSATARSSSSSGASTSPSSSFSAISSMTITPEVSISASFSSTPSGQAIESATLSPSASASYSTSMVPEASMSEPPSASASSSTSAVINLDPFVEAACAAKPFLKRGSGFSPATQQEKDYVQGLQILLNFKLTNSAPIDEDGLFGQGTEDVVIAFQTQAQIDIDGMVGLQTWGAL